MEILLHPVYKQYMYPQEYSSSLLQHPREICIFT